MVVGSNPVVVTGYNSVIKDGKLPRVKLTNSQLKKFTSATKKKTWTTLRITKKNFQDEESSHELLLIQDKIRKKEMLLFPICWQI